MEIRFMRQSALDTLKNSLANIFTNYFIESDSAWVEKIFPNPFGKFCDVPNFELAPLDTGLTVGQIELENCKRLYENLKFMTESQAADERLWAGLCHDIFYDYVRRRFGYDSGKTDFSTAGEYDTEKFKSVTDREIKYVKNRFFLNGGARERLIQNPLARYWWTGRAFYDENNRSNHFEKLNLIGANDFYTKIFSTLTRSFVENPRLLKGVVLFMEHCKNNGIELDANKNLRPALSEVNRVGGAVILDCLSEREIADVMIEYVENIPASKKIVVDTRTVKMGSKVTVISLDNGAQRNYIINENFKRQCPELFKVIFNEFIGKKIDSVVTLPGKKSNTDGKFKITDIQ